jgi:hypothetical protein
MLRFVLSVKSLVRMLADILISVYKHMSLATGRSRVFLGREAVRLGCPLGAGDHLGVTSLIVHQ